MQRFEINGAVRPIYGSLGVKRLKFNVGTGGIHQLPQTTWDGIHSLLQEVVWDVGDNVLNPVLQLFHCTWFAQYTSSFA